MEGAVSYEILSPGTSFLLIESVPSRSFSRMPVIHGQTCLAPKTTGRVRQFRGQPTQTELILGLITTLGGTIDCQSVLTSCCRRNKLARPLRPSPGRLAIPIATTSNIVV